MRAQALGHRLVRDIQRPGNAFDLNRIYTGFLRGLLNKFLVYHYPEQFSGAIRIQQERRQLPQA